MNYNEILAAAKDQVGPYCKACPVCNGKACGNSMPGPGCKYPGNTAARNFDKWQEICVNMDTLCPNADPDVSFEMFGVKFAAPVFAAPLGAIDLHYGPKYKDPEYNEILIKACADYGVMALTGDGVDPNIMLRSVEDMKKVEGMGCPVIKPWNKEAVFEKLDVLNEAKIFCAGMDVDGAGLPFLKAMNPNAGSKSVPEMREIIEYARSSSPTTAAECRAACPRLPRCCPRSSRPSRARPSSSSTAVSAPAWTCSARSPWVRTRCSSAAPSCP